MTANGPLNDPGRMPAKWHLPNDDAPDVRFFGTLLASAASSGDPSSGRRYSGIPFRWTELELYRTRGGRYVCHRADRSGRDDERDRFRTRACETVADVMAFFGYGWLAKELYIKAGLGDDASVIVD